MAIMAPSGNFRVLLPDDFDIGQRWCTAGHVQLCRADHCAAGVIVTCLDPAHVNHPVGGKLRADDDIAKTALAAIVHCRNTRYLSALAILGIDQKQLALLVAHQRHMCQLDPATRQECHRPGFIEIGDDGGIERLGARLCINGSRAAGHRQQAGGGNQGLFRHMGLL